MTSGVAELRHAGSVAEVQVLLAPSAWAMKPSICPPSMSAVALVSPCGPPPLTSAWSTYGWTQLPVWGSGTQTEGTPSCMGMPSAPGKVPK